MKYLKNASGNYYQRKYNLLDEEIVDLQNCEDNFKWNFVKKYKSKKKEDRLFKSTNVCR